MEKNIKNIIILILLIALLAQNFFLTRKVDLAIEALVNHFHMHKTEELLNKLDLQKSDHLNSPSYQTFDLLHKYPLVDGEPNRIR